MHQAGPIRRALVCGLVFSMTPWLAGCGGSSSPAAAAPPPAVLLAPVIASEPAPQSVAVGAAATFAVGVTGTQLSYQWHRNGVDIAGATAASYTLPATAFTDTHSQLSVTVSNASGSVASSTAALSVSGIALLAGSLTDSGAINGASAAARFYAPAGLAADSAGNIYVSDYGNNLVRKIGADAMVSTLAGGGSIVPPLAATTSTLALQPGYAVAVDSGQNVYFATGAIVAKISPQGALSYPLQAPMLPSDGRASAAFYFSAVALDASGNIYASNSLGTRKVTPAGATTILEGVDTASLSGTQIVTVKGLATDASGNAYVSAGATILKAGANGSAAPLAGGNLTDAGGGAVTINPGPIAVDASGNIYLVNGALLRKITPTGVVTTVIGQSSHGAVLGALPGALPKISGIAIDAHGLMYVSAGNAILQVQLP